MQNLKQKIAGLVANKTCKPKEPSSGPSTSTSQAGVFSTQVIHAVSPIIPLAAPERFSGDPHNKFFLLNVLSIFCGDQ